MKPICIIPARRSSKGIPNKNITKILGVPLIGHVIQNVRNSKIFSHVIVSTEDKSIAKIAKKYGAEVPFMRPKYLATSNATMDDVLLHATKKLLELNIIYMLYVIISLEISLIKTLISRN